MLGFRLTMIATLLIGLSAQAPPGHPAYAAGQVWRYSPRPGDEGSLLKIGRVETDPAFQQGRPIYHISVIGVHMGVDRHVTEIGHLPVSQETLDMSVIALSDSNAPFPNVENGIEQWRQAKGGVFTLTVAQIVAVTDRTMQGVKPTADPH